MGNPFVADPFAALPPVPTALVIDGESLELTPLKVGELPAFARAVQPLVDSLSVSNDWMALLTQHGEAVIAAVAIASRRPEAWVAGLEIDEAVRLADAVFEVNADFFIRRLLPVITETACRIGQRLGGPASSSA